MFEQLQTTPRLLLQAQLYPLQGDRFQPTGFADLGAALYRRADGTRMLLVESAQSVANRLEATIIGPDSELVDELTGLSYIHVQMTGDSDATTNSLIEAHRINSPFIISDKAFKSAFSKDAGYQEKAPIDWRKAAAALFKYDVNSLLHGAFMANLGDGRLRFARALTGFIEAEGVQEVVSGGVKNNPIDPTGKLRASDYDKDVYGNVPYQRVEFTASKIVAYFNLDIGLLRSYDLGQDAFELLVALALFKVQRFINAGLRLRTACDFKQLGSLDVSAPSGFLVPSEQQLLDALRERIPSLRSMFANPAVTRLTTKAKLGGKSKGAKESES